MQPHLIPPPPYQPLPTGSHCYVPVLQNRIGEREALAHASSSTWAQMTPVIEVVPYGGAMSHDSIMRHARRLKRCVGEHPFYLDLKGIAPCTSTPARSGDSRALIELLLSAATKKSLHFMPVAWTDSDETHLGAVSAAAHESGHGLALRHRLGSAVFRSGDRFEDRLVRCLSDMDIASSSVDLMIDLEYLEPDSEPSARWLRDLLNRAASVGPWRSYVLIATSVPSSFGNGLVPEDSTAELKRREWELWTGLEAEVKMPLAYGDYVIQNPTPPLDPPPVGPWANIRYTTDEDLVVARGFNLREVSTEQYQELSKRIKGHGSFRSRTYSYGDAEIFRWATQPGAATRLAYGDIDAEDGSDADSSKPGSLGYWRGVGSSHHLALVTQQLRERSENGA